MFASFRDAIKSRSLTFRLEFSILTCVLLGGLAMLAFMSKHYQPIIRAYTEEQAKKSLQEVVSNVTSFVWEAQDAALSIKNTLKELHADDVDMIRNLLHSSVQVLRYDKEDPLHAWVYVFPDGAAKHGILYSAMIEQDNFIFSNTEVNDFYNLFPWFKEVPKLERTFWSEPYIDEELPNKPWVVTCLQPFKFIDSEEFNGLVAVSINLDYLRKDIIHYNIKDRGEIILNSAKGLYIAHPDKKVQLKKTIFDLAKEEKFKVLQTVGDDLLQGKEGIVEMSFSSIFNEPVIIFYAPIPGVNWGASVAYPKKWFLKPIRDFQRHTLFAILFGLILLSVIISRICHYSTKPLLDLSKIALQYGKGDFSAALPESASNDEIGAMNRAFHNMRSNLLHHIKAERQAASELQRSQSELEIAASIQESALPKDFPHNSSFEICASMIPARKIGGDFYDFFFIDKTHFAIVIADVSGKGIPAALFMMNAKTLIKNTAESGCTISQIFDHVNNDLCKGNNTGTFVTAFIGVLDISNGQFVYVNAGHNPPFLYTNKKYKLLDVPTNTVLGGLEDYVYQSETITLSAGDRIFLYTDGISEAQDSKGQMFGEERIQKVLSQSLTSAAKTLQVLHHSIGEFVQNAEQSDDMTMLELIYKGNSSDLYIDAFIENEQQVLDFLQNDMQKNNIPADKQNKVIVAAEEIFSNIALYAYSKKGRVRISATKTNDKYIVTFYDKGKVFNPLLLEDPNLTAPAESRKTGGLGVFLIKQLMDYTDYQYKNNCNILAIGIDI